MADRLQNDIEDSVVTGKHILMSCGLMRQNSKSFRQCVILGLLLCAALIVPSCNRQPESTTTQPVTSVPSRIVAFAPSSVEIVAELGQTHRLVAVGDFCHYPPDVSGLQKVGGVFDPDLEAILVLQPDLIILRGSNDNVERLCRENGIRVYHDPVESVEDIFTAIQDLGELLDAREAAEKLSASLQSRLDNIAVAVGHCQRPRVLFTVARKPDALRGIITSGKGTFITSMIELAGGENVFGRVDAAYPDVGPEAILAAQPEVIIEAMPEVELTSELQESIRRQWLELGPIPATRNNRVYILTDDNVLIPSPRIVETVTNLARLLHPEVDLG